VVSTNLLETEVSQILHASNTLLTILQAMVVIPSTNARTALGHHAQLGRPAKINAGPLTTSTTMPKTTTHSTVLLR